jgi:hypothetical protein
MADGVYGALKMQNVSHQDDNTLLTVPSDSTFDLQFTSQLRLQI